MTDELLIPFVTLILVGILAVIAWKRPGWGAVLVLFASIGGFIAGAAFQDVFVAVMAILTWPLMTGIICFTPQSSPLERPWYRTFAKLLLMVFVYAAVLVLMGFLFNFFGALFFILLVIGIIRYVQVSQYTRVLEVISTVAMSIRQSLPLPMALQTAAHGQHRKTADILTNIAHWLTQGYSLSESMRRGYAKCPPAVMAAITAAEAMNQLPRALDTLQADISEKVNEYKRIRPVHPWYPVIILLLVSIIVLGLMVFIIPTFAEVLHDMSDGAAGLPWLTQKLLNVSSWLLGRKGLNLLFTSASIVLLAGLLVHVRFHKRNPQQPRLLSRAGDWIKWHLPVVHWFERNYSQWQLTEILKIGLKAGHPVNTTVRNALSLDMNHCYRRRIAAWLRCIEQGDNLSRSAACCGIGRTIAWSLDESVNKGNAPTILASLEDVYRSRYNYRLNLLNAVLCPLMVIALGCVVGFVVLGMFLPMVKMIQVLL